MYNARVNPSKQSPTLLEACPWLHDDAARHTLILEVTESSSVIAGLPPFDEETRQRILRQLQDLAARRGIQCLPKFLDHQSMVLLDQYRASGRIVLVDSICDCL